MKQFPVLGKTITFSDNEEKTVEFRLAFRKLGYISAQSFDEVYKKFENIDQVYAYIDEVGKLFINTGINKLVDYLIEYGIYDATVESIVESNRYDDICSDWNNTVYFFSRDYEELHREYNQEVERRSNRLDNRARVVGGGFGVSGALKGALFAEGVNLATGALHGVVNFIGNALDRSALERKKEKMFGKRFYREEFKRAIHLTINSLWMHLVSMLKWRLLLLYPREEQFNKAENLYKNFVAQKIPENKKAEVLFEIIQNNVNFKSIYEEQCLSLVDSKTRDEILDLGFWLDINLERTDLYYHLEEIGIENIEVSNDRQLKMALDGDESSLKVIVEELQGQGKCNFICKICESILDKDIINYFISESYLEALENDGQFNRINNTSYLSKCLNYIEFNQNGIDEKIIYLLARAYKMGIGRSPTPEKALSYFKRLDDPNSKYEVARLMLHIDYLQAGTAFNILKDLDNVGSEEARTYLEKIRQKDINIDLADAQSMFNLGALYKTGELFNYDIVRLPNEKKKEGYIYWVDKAINAGYEEAKPILGRMYREDAITLLKDKIKSYQGKDYKPAIELLLKASSLGDEESMSYIHELEETQALSFYKNDGDAIFYLSQTLTHRKKEKVKNSFFDLMSATDSEKWLAEAKINDSKLAIAYEEIMMCIKTHKFSNELVELFELEEFLRDPLVQAYLAYQAALGNYQGFTDAIIFEKLNHSEIQDENSIYYDNNDFVTDALIICYEKEIGTKRDLNKLFDLYIKYMGLTSYHELNELNLYVLYEPALLKGYSFAKVLLEQSEIEKNQDKFNVAIQYMITARDEVSFPLAIEWCAKNQDIVKTYELYIQLERQKNIFRVLSLVEKVKEKKKDEELNKEIREQRIKEAVKQSSEVHQKTKVDESYNQTYRRSDEWKSNRVESKKDNIIKEIINELDDGEGLSVSKIVGIIGAILIWGGIIWKIIKRIF